MRAPRGIESGESWRWEQSTVHRTYMSFQYVKIRTFYSTFGVDANRAASLMTVAHFWLLDEVVVARAAIGVPPGSDWQVGGRNRFSVQPNN